MLSRRAALDVRDRLGADHARPTLVLHRPATASARSSTAATSPQHISGARYVELEGDDHLWWLPDPRQVAAAGARLRQARNAASTIRWKCATSCSDSGMSRPNGTAPDAMPRWTASTSAPSSSPTCRENAISSSAIPSGTSGAKK